MPKVTRQNKKEQLLVEAGPSNGSSLLSAGTEDDSQQPMALEDEKMATAEVAPPRPKFAPVTTYEENGSKVEFRRVSVPQHRMTPLKNNWLALYKPVTENLKLDMRMNLKSRKVLSVSQTFMLPDFDFNFVFC